MSRIPTALRAAAGGALAGTAGLPILPDDTPWYGYLILYALSVGLPALIGALTPRKDGA